jgi:hypothetical protein
VSFLALCSSMHLCPRWLAKVQELDRKKSTHQFVAIARDE